MPSSLNEQLLDAVKNNKLEEVIFCLRKGADVKAQNEMDSHPYIAHPSKVDLNWSSSSLQLALRLMWRARME